MAVSKVIYSGQTLVDLTGDTVTSESILSGVTAHDSSGAAVTGTFVDRGFPNTIMPGDTPVVCCWDTAYSTNNSTMVDTGLSLTIPRDGEYRVKWAVMGIGGGNITVATRLFKNGAAAGTKISSTFDGYVSMDATCKAGDVLTLKMTGATMIFSYVGSISGFCACIDWDTGF